MTRYQKSVLLIGALILVALVALIGVLVLRPTPLTPLSINQQTETAIFEFLATNAETVQAIQTGMPLTVTALMAEGE